MRRTISKQLKTLRAITPRAEWQASCKQVLLSQLASQGMGTSRPGIMAGIHVYTRTVFTGAYRYTLGSAFAHPTAMGVAVMVVLFGGSVAAMGSQNSLPGDTLYSVKKTGETIQVALTPADKKSELQMELVGYRLAELDAISKQPISDEEKSRKVDSIVSDVTLTLSSAGQHLEDIQSTKEPQRVTQVATAVSQQAVRAEEGLTKAKQSLSKEVKKTTAPKVKEALAQANSTTSKALAVAIGNTIKTPSVDVKNNIQQRIKIAEQKVVTLNQIVKIAADTKGTDASEVAKVTQTSKEASAKLNTAKQSLADNDLTAALTVLDESYQLVIDAEESADAIILPSLEDPKETDPKDPDKDSETNNSDDGIVTTPVIEPKTETPPIENNQNTNNTPSLEDVKE